MSTCQFDLLVWQPLRNAASFAPCQFHYLGLICVRAAWAEDLNSNSRNAKTQIPELRLLQSQHALTVGPQAEHIG